MIDVPDAPVFPPFTPYQQMIMILKAIPLGVGMTVEDHFYEVYPNTLQLNPLGMTSRDIIIETLMNCTTAFYMQSSVTVLTNNMMDEVKYTLQNPEDAAVKGSCIFSV